MRKLVSPLLVLGATVGLFGLLLWAPWRSDQRPREVAWVEDYAAWLDRAAEGRFGQDACASVFADEVGPPPTDRLEPLAAVAADACSSFPDPPRWAEVADRAAGELLSWHALEAEKTLAPRLGRVASDLAGTPVSVRCWAAEDWEQLAEEWRLIDREEFWVTGFAKPHMGEVHLSPDVCDALRLFYERSYSPRLSGETLRVAEALLTLAHEAEHMRVPDANEATVECYALQRVRGLAREAGRARGYADELAALVVEISHPKLPPEYRTRRCRPNGPLDLRPRDPVWP